MKIAIVTDTHLSPKDSLLERNWQVVCDWISETAADLVIHLGDITANGVNDPQELTHARALLSKLNRDLLVLPGNHDIGDNPATDGSPPGEPLNPQRLEEYRRLFGPDWWSVHVEGWQMIGLNAELLGTDGPDERDQTAWLQRSLGSSDGPLGVMLHKPIRSVGPTLESGRYPPRQASADLLSLLGSRDLRFVASGHTHQAFRSVQGRAEHIWVPSTAFCIPDAIQEPIGEKCVGAMVLELDGDIHRAIVAAPAGLVCHNLLDLDHIYPQITPMRARLGPLADL